MSNEKAPTMWGQSSTCAGKFAYPIAPSALENVGLAVWIFQEALALAIGAGFPFHLLAFIPLLQLLNSHWSLPVTLEAVT